MNASDIKDRAAGAVMGSLIGDALGVGPHWYYDLDQLRSDYGDWIDDYTEPKPDRYHAGLKAGQNSQTGQVVAILLESVVSHQKYMQSDFTDRLDALLSTLDGSPSGGRYTDAAMRHVWRARQAGLDWSEAGSYADTAEAAVRTSVLAARYHGELDLLLRHMLSNVLLTHRDPFIVGQSVAFGLILAASIEGHPLPDMARVINAQARSQNVTLELRLRLSPEDSEPVSVPFFDALLQPGWSHAAARDPSIYIEPPQAACRLFGLACTLGFMLPAVYYFNARFENDFEMAVLSALNGGGNNMARAGLTGALAGARIGLSGIPKRLIKGLWEHERLLDMVDRLVGFPATESIDQEICMKAPEWAEHHRLKDADQPCDDGRSGNI
jgi:ADP-ribosyl-[dinitrogen reductase] hydrolase